ncbi:hypothetical protein K505DRAFT_326852 [Melanomma pulvis-pyrius CBS 109.77]|uniref:Uncharacterized protein n=1 Tax=Melanomma pulvis-pyrius CBS 109.77 TaxID=1314802 RepID=A0A6A6X678_9PLEO|nr:hypothetical protein K505DRAFT_326852 [Melanomma pulvis-pyrius CBS 109.77]
MLKAQADEDIEYYAKVACHDLCATLYSTLPRELRQRVYSHLIGTSWVHVSKSFCNSQSSPDIPALLRHQQDWNTPFVSQEVKEEIAETWYSTSVFEFTDLFLINVFFHEDRLGLGLAPGRFVSNVQVSIDCARYFESKDEYERAQIGHIKEFRKLFKIKKGAKINVYISTIYLLPKGEGFTREDIFYNAFKFAFPALHPLVNTGYQVQISSYGIREFAFTGALLSPQGAVDNLVFDAVKSPNTQ